MRRANTFAPALKLLNGEITSDMHKQNLWKEHLDAHWNYTLNTHIPLNTIHSLSNRSPPHTLNTPHNIQQQNNNHTQKANRSINRATQKIQGYNITLTTIQVQEAIKQSKNNNSQGPEKL